MDPLETLKKIGWDKRKLGLERIRNICLKLDNPQDKLKIIHVAGTNGKGSTCAFLNQILIESGFKVGLFTSPYLHEVYEQFQVDNVAISKERFNQLFDTVFSKRADESVFEILTAIALLYFLEEKVDYAIIETGMGGRLDSTNIVNPILTIITNVSLDHTEYLGTTIKQIAEEKAAIIKKEIPCITGAQAEALEVIKQHCSSKGSKLMVIKDANNMTKEFELSLKGEFQKMNAALAIKAADQILNLSYDSSYNDKSKKSKKKIIQDALKNTKWPGRFQKVDDLIIDCAHNPAGLRVILKEMPDDIPIVFGVLKDKPIKEMAALIQDKTSRIILTRPNAPRSMQPYELSKFFNEKIIIAEDPKTAVKIARKTFTGSILVVGSCYLAKEFL
ncbi:bifunctional folylpolyglutamate synthase/dihydrofolate synthase [Candidatus Woesearchaeota archaeon]|nr:bifunctional folylpolyglutamate synthase/dihydrofolate synthase [Candidatus Woesearchaeota archaeon]